MKIIIDRFEGDSVVVELPNRQTVAVPKQVFDPDVKEGDVIEVKADREETEVRKRNVEKLMDELWEK